MPAAIAPAPALPTGRTAGSRGRGRARAGVSPLPGFQPQRAPALQGLEDPLDVLYLFWLFLKTK